MKEPLSIKQKRAIDALLRHSTVKDAAKASNTSQRTLERWLSKPEFQEGLRQAQIEAHQSIMREISGLQVEALNAARDILRNPDQPGASNKLKAAIKILDYGNKSYELANIEDRIKELEGKIA